MNVDVGVGVKIVGRPYLKIYNRTVGNMGTKLKSSACLFA
jgi:hypothetical protein